LNDSKRFQNCKWVDNGLMYSKLGEVDEELKH